MIRFEEVGSRSDLIEIACIDLSESLPWHTMMLNELCKNTYRDLCGGFGANIESARTLYSSEFRVREALML